MTIQEQQEMLNALKQLAAKAGDVAVCWESGNLAEAVREMSSARKRANSIIRRTSSMSASPIDMKPRTGEEPMKLTVEINTNNAAFEDYGLVAELTLIFNRMLNKWSRSDEPYDCKLMDSNGNSVGRATLDDN